MSPRLYASGPSAGLAHQPDPGLMRRPVVAGGAMVLLAGSLLIAQTLDGMDMNALAFVGAGVRKDLGLTRSVFGACVGAAFLGTAAGAVVFGAAADRIGRRRTLVAVVLLFGVASLLTSRIADGGQLMLMRVLTGVALGGLLPVSTALLTGSVAAPARTAAVTIVASGSAAGTVVAGLVASSVVPILGWRAMFTIGGIAPLLIAPLLLLVVPPDPRRERASFADRVSRGGREPAGGSLFRGGAWRLTSCLWIGMFLAALPVFTAVGWLPSLLQARGVALPRAALVASTFSIAGALGGVGAGALADRLGAKVIMPIALAGALSIAGLGMVRGGPADGLLVGAAGAFAVGLINLMGALAGQFYPDRVRGRGVGASLAAMRIGAATAPWAAGRLLDAGVGDHALFTLCGAAALLSGLAFAGSARWRPPIAGTSEGRTSRP